ncbi:MAG: ribonuclease P protein component [Pseudonocardiaceae bacterium]
MLPAPTRLTRREDFSTAVRRGRRAARRTLVVHLDRSGDPTVPPRVGFIVGRTVGGSVVRHRVQRRLRHLMRTRLSALPSGALLVVRALPAAARAGSTVLGHDIDGALRRLGDAPADSSAAPPPTSPTEVATESPADFLAATQHGGR